MLAGELTAGTGAAEDWGRRVQEIRRGDVVALPAAAALPQIERVVRRPLQADKATLLGDFAPVGRSSGVGCKGVDLLLCDLSHRVIRPF